MILNFDLSRRSLKQKYMTLKDELAMSVIFWAHKSLQMVIAAMKLKDAYCLEGKL